MRSIKHCIATLLLLLPTHGIAQERIYADIYAAECSRAISFYRLHESEFEAAADRAGVSADFLFAIVAPEVSQYGNLGDIAQTYALKTLYVQAGKDYADFSIGRFQMKPSFVEQLEQYVHDEDSLLALFPEIMPTKEEGRNRRSERVERLERPDWQLKYLAVFCRVVQHRFSTTEFASEPEKLRFYANAYNAGFFLDSRQLQQCRTAYFPHFARQKFRYADVSLWFYENISSGTK